jgi:serine/threonine protein phosphatase PrpC
MNLFRRLFGSKQQKKRETPSLSDEESYNLAVQKTMEEAAETKPMLDGIEEAIQTRPLPPPKEFSSTTDRFTVGQNSNVGRMRTNNQDACLSMVISPSMVGEPPAIGFFVVADGMGGHTDGEQASAVTVQTLAQRVIDEIVLPHLMGRERSSDQKTIAEVLSDAMLAANDATQQNVPNGGTTATCAVIRGDLAYIAHVGDSRAYLISEGNMELVTRDHSLVRRLQELGQLTPEEAEVHPQRNVLYRAIGQGEELEVDAATRRLPPSSRLLLCSDGLWGLVDDQKMMEVLEKHTNPQAVCDQLVELANEAGGSDNITALLIQMPN